MQRQLWSICLMLVLIASPVAWAESISAIPGGQTIGVQLQGQGLLVVGKYKINNTEAAAEVRTGDRITHANGSSLENTEQFRKIVQVAGGNKQPIKLTVLRDGQRIPVSVTPFFDDRMKTYRTGLYVRDKTVGIGTLSFILPEKHRYGALGHPINESGTEAKSEQVSGSIFSADVTGFRKGTPGVPGEKHATWSPLSKEAGTIDKNSRFGIFGNWTNAQLPDASSAKMQVAEPNEVHTGDATLLTSIRGNQVEPFNVQIIQTVPQATPDVKSMLVKVTDPRLLETTGGIVQGMSGSPIVQDGKLVGVLTHVLVNQPAVGFAAYMKWMIGDAAVAGNANAA